MAYVYADVLFVLNFIMDFIVMKSAAGLCGRRAKTYKTALGAGLASLTYCVFFCLGIGGWALFTMALAGMLAGLALAFCPMRIRSFGILAVCQVVLTFVIGGCCMAVYYNMPGNIPGLKSFPAWLLGLTAAAGYMALKFTIRRVKRGAMSKAKLTEVSVCLLGKVTGFTALVDTGHSVWEPISGKPVIVAEFSILKDILPKEAAVYFQDGANEAEKDLEKASRAFSDGGLASRIRIIPYRSIGEKAGAMVGFRPDYCVIGGERTDGAVVGICEESLARDGEYKGLINPELLINY